MTNSIISAEIKKEFHLKNGDRLVLIDRMAMEKTYGKLECARNIYLIGQAGDIIWQIHSNFDDEGAPFTNLSVNNDMISAYRWDGGTYTIDAKTGFAVPAILDR
jgi:hypothetical protein